MKTTFKAGMMFALIGSLALLALAQEKPPKVDAGQPRPLVLTDAVVLPGVLGRFDHFATDGKGRVFIPAYGNNSVEVVDISARVRTHSITGVPSPQGLAYSPESNQLFVGSDEGKLYIFNGETLALSKTIDFHDDVDNLRYDAASKRVYVGYGDGEDGAIGIVDALTDERLPEEYKLGAHPESFQLEKAGPHIYVNLPDLDQVAVIDRHTHSITRWKMTIRHNFPMALDEPDHRLFVITHLPARLVVMDTATGKVLAALPCPQEADDAFYDRDRKRIYITSAEGYIAVFQQSAGDHYALLTKIPTAIGARTAGYFGKGKKGFDRFFLAVPARADRGAEMWIFSVQD